ncbi:UNVERIFIED_ORG: Flp pilus assembly protein TadG [Arthrobacter sp. UYEF2]
MRRLNTNDHERGVIAPVAAFLMVVLLGFAALAVDVATMYSEHAQLQNGADAAALAIAQQCSKAATPCPSDQKTAAANYADGNAVDGHSNVLSAIANATAKTADVTTQSRTAGGTNHFSLQFARVLGFASTDIQAKATATWGYPNSGGGFPLAFSKSCWDLGPATAGTGTVQQISWKPGTPSCTNASGHTIPGGWGWLTQSSPCYAITATGNAVASDPGNNSPTGCYDVLNSWITTLTNGGAVQVTFPIFDTATGSGNTGTFHIVGYATFKIFGWHFGNASGPYEFRDKATDPGMNSYLACSGGNDRCIIGEFVQFQTSGGGGGGQDFGTSSVSLSK